MFDNPELFPTPDSETNPERKAIRAAMNRLLGGAPMTIPVGSAPTVVNLAKEAGVKRGALTHRHTDLQDEFRARAAAAAIEGKTIRELELEQELADALKEVQTIREERTNWKNAADDFVRIIQTLELESENQRNVIEALKKRLERADQRGNVTNLRPHKV